MTELEQCANYSRSGKQCTISCKLGLWEVNGTFGLALINEASNYFEQYKKDGEYSSILGGESVIDVLTKNRDI